jgi:hypothetical protein
LSEPRMNQGGSTALSQAAVAAKATDHHSRSAASRCRRSCR